MPFTLKIIFTGLIAFVPVDKEEHALYLDSSNGYYYYDGTTQVASSLDHLWVLLVDARNPDPSTDNKGKKFHRHRAALRFGRDVEATGRTIDATCPAGTFCEGDRIVNLADEQLIATLPGGSSPPTYFRGARVPALPLPCCTKITEAGCAAAKPVRKCLNQPHLSSQDQMADASWLVSFEEVIKGTRLNDDLWRKASLPKNTLVARLRLDAGVLRTELLQHEGTGEPANAGERFNRAAAFWFKPTGGVSWTEDRARAIAKRMELIVTNVTGPLKLASSSLVGGSPADPLVLGPPDGCDGCVLTLELLNAPEEEILPASDPTPMTGMSRRHFELLWNLTTSPPKKRPAPAPLVTGGSQYDLICPEVRP